MNLVSAGSSRDNARMDIPADLTISITDLRRAGNCARMGHFFHSHGLRQDYRKMIKGEGISARKLAATGDPRAIRAVQLKIESQGS